MASAPELAKNVSKCRRRGLVASGNRVGKHACTVRIIVSEFGQQRRDLATLLDVEVVRHMQKLFGLSLERRKHCRVAVAQAAHADAGKKIEVFAAIVAGELHAAAFDKLDRRATKGVHDVVGFERLLCCK